MPLILEAGLACKELNISLSDMGFDVSNPKVIRDVQMAISVYETALDRRRTKQHQKNAPKDSKYKAESWEKQNPDGAKLLRWAAGKAMPDNVNEFVTDDGEMLVRVEIPVRKDR